MRLFPSARIVYKTRLRSFEIVSRLQDVTEETRWFRPKLPGLWSSRYEGIVDESSFSVRRIPPFRNSFVPEINGTIEDEGFETTIAVIIHFHNAVKTFLLLACALPVAIVANAFFQAAYRGSFDTSLLFLLLIPVGIVLVGHFVFRLECNKADEELQELFAAEDSDRK